MAEAPAAASNGTEQAPAQPAEETNTPEATPETTPAPTEPSTTEPGGPTDASEGPTPTEPETKKDEGDRTPKIDGEYKGLVDRRFGDQPKFYVPDVAPATSDVFKAAMEEFGEVADAIVMPGRFGFCTFKGKEGTEKAMAKGEVMVEGRSLPLSLAKPKRELYRSRGMGGRPGVYPEQKEPKVYVGDIPAVTNTEQLKEAMTKFGKVTECLLMSGGFAFVTFEAKDQMEAALKEGKVELHGRTCKVEIARPKPDRSFKRRRHEDGYYDGGYGYDDYRGGRGGPRRGGYDDYDRRGGYGGYGGYDRGYGGYGGYNRGYDDYDRGFRRGPPSRGGYGAPRGGGSYGGYQTGYSPYSTGPPASGARDGAMY